MRDAETSAAKCYYPRSLCRTSAISVRSGFQLKLAPTSRSIAGMLVLLRLLLFSGALARADYTNATATGLRAMRRFRYELTAPVGLHSAMPIDKRPLALVVACGLDCCGVDRCMMGQPCMGLAKALTLGGLLVWWLFEHVVLTANMIMCEDQLEVVGYHIKFIGSTTLQAFWITVFGLCLTWWNAPCRRGLGNGDISYCK